jgi:gas vesicle protein
MYYFRKKRNYAGYIIGGLIIGAAALYVVPKIVEKLSSQVYNKSLDDNKELKVEAAEEPVIEKKADAECDQCPETEVKAEAAAEPEAEEKAEAETEPETEDKAEHVSEDEGEANA